MIPFRINDPHKWAVWIDLDDTLWNFTHNSWLTLEEVYHHFRLDRFWSEVDGWRNDYHAVNARLWRELENAAINRATLRRQRFLEPFAAAGMDAAEAESIASVADKYYLEHLASRSVLMPGAKELLVRLKDRGFRLGVLSNGFSDIQHAKMRSAGIDHYMDYVVLSDTLDIDKPDARIFAHAAATAGADASRCIMIGDNSKSDIAGALGAGWAAAVWYNPRHAPTDPALTEILAQKDSVLCTVRHLDSVIL